MLGQLRGLVKSSGVKLSMAGKVALHKCGEGVTSPGSTNATHHSVNLLR